MVFEHVLPIYLHGLRALQPLVHLMQGQLEVAGEKWQQEQYCKASSSSLPPVLRMTDFYSGRLTKAYFTEVRSLLLEPHHWTLLPQVALTQHYVSTAFAMLARGAGGIVQLLMCLQLSFPIRIFGLLTEGAAQVAAEMEGVWQVMPCMLDDLTTKFMEKFPTAVDLLSKESYDLYFVLVLEVFSQKSPFVICVGRTPYV